MKEESDLLNGQKIVTDGCVLLATNQPNRFKEVAIDLHYQKSGVGYQVFPVYRGANVTQGGKSSKSILTARG